MKKFILLMLSVVALASCTQKETTTVQQPQVNKRDVVTENIMNRRSIRSYKTDQVSKAQLDTILQCAINAPSANNKQSWEVRVIQNANLLKKIKEIGGEFYDSPSVIIIAKDKDFAYSSFDCGLLAQNIMLSAESMDLGTCSLGMLARLLTEPKSKEIVDALDLPANYEIILGMSLGQKNERPEAKPRDTSKVKYID